MKCIDCGRAMVIAKGRCHKCYYRAVYANNTGYREKRKEYSKNYAKVHPVEKRKNNAEYRKLHPDKFRKSMCKSYLRRMKREDIEEILRDIGYAELIREKEARA